MNAAPDNDRPAAPKRAGSSTDADLRARLRALPSVDELRRAIVLAHTHMGSEPDETAPELSRERTRERQITQAARHVLDGARQRIRDGGSTPSIEALRREVACVLDEAARPALRSVINATGVIVNTNLGRAPLSDAALAHITEVAHSYSNLEYDLEAGERGSRQVAVRALVCQLTGAEDALVVNNNAAAVLLALTALAGGREVILSRGELVEIGGGFRVPDVMRQSGARLVEVGTTNRTRVADFAAAITPETAALLAVHPSNFRIIGFTEAPSLVELAELAHEHGLLLLHDLGSGALVPTERYGLAHEPMPQESIAAGVDLVCFSGDKLLGGPQAGILAGKASLIATLARHPLARALRIDKLSLAALEATLRQHRDGISRDLPVWHMIALPPGALRARAERWEQRLRAADLEVETLAGFSTVGGGSLPGETLPTTLCAIVQADEAARAGDGNRVARPIADVGALAARLRTGSPPVVTRVLRRRLLLDPRTVPPDQDDALIDAVLAAVDALSERATG